MKLIRTAVVAAASLCPLWALANTCVPLQAGATDQSVYLEFIDETTGIPNAGLAFNSSGIDLEYVRSGAAAVDITEATQTANGAHADGGFVSVGHGRYRLDLPDAAVAAGVPQVVVQGTITGYIMLPCVVALSPPANAVAWAGAATATDDVALLASLAKGTHITGFNDITAASVWGVDATGQQTQGTFGQAIGDPGADTDSIWSLANTNLNATVGSRMATFSLPTNFSSLAITAGGAVTAGTVSDKTGYSLTQSFPTNFASMDINATGGVGIDWGNVQNPTTTVGLTGTTVDLVTGAVDDTAINSASELAAAAQTGAASALTSYDPPTRAELTADKAEIMSMIGQRTTITVTDQDTFTLAAGPDRDDAVRGWAVMLLETGNDGETDLVRVADYVGSSKTVELARAAGFTIATGDVAVLLPAFLDTPVDTALVNCTVNTANFAGSTTTLACILTDKDGGAVTAASGDLTGLELKITSGAQAYEGRFINSTTWDDTNDELQLTLSRALPATLADGVTAIIR